MASLKSAGMPRGSGQDELHADDQDHQTNRRRHVRIRLQPMYSFVEVKPKRGGEFAGHAYDISESGVRIELDVPLIVGERVQLSIQLPGQSAMGPKESAIHAAADVVWVNPIEDDPGPRRMALQFDGFHTPGDRDSLMQFVDAGAQRAAA